MKHLMLILGVVLSLNAFSMPPVLRIDRIYYEGQSYQLLNYALYSYFRKFPEKIPEPDFWHLHIRTGRQHESKLVVQNDKVYLTEINLWRCDSTRENHHVIANVIKDVFPNKNKFELEKLNIDLVFGENVFQKRIIQKYIHLRVEKGRVVSVKKLNTRGLKQLRLKLYEEFKETDRYKELKEYYGEYCSQAQTKEKILDRIFDYTSSYED